MTLWSISGRLLQNISVLLVTCQWNFVRVLSDAGLGIVDPKHIVERGKVATYNHFKVIPTGQVASLNNGLFCKGELEYIFVIILNVCTSVTQLLKHTVTVVFPCHSVVLPVTYILTNF